jgi:heme exporter protein C
MSEERLRRESRMRSPADLLRGPERIAARAVRPTGIALAVLLPVYAWSVASAPQAVGQGVWQKILYLHPPLAFDAYLGFFLTGLGGLLYLWTRREHFDRLAIASAGVGVVYCSLVLVTGAIWGKAAWNNWWAREDPRLTLTAVLWFVYLAYIMLRAFNQGGEREARIAAVYGILGVLLIPLNYYVIDLAGGRAAHPANLERDSIGSGLRLPFFLGLATWLLTFLHLLARRWVVQALRATAARRQAEARPLGEEYA